MSINVGHLEATLGLNTAALAAGLTRAQASMRRAGRTMQRAGRTLTMGISLPLIAAGGGAVKLAADFEKSMSKIEGLVGIAADKVNAFKSDVMALAGRTAKAPLELADALFFVTSAGLRGADALDVLEASAKASAAGLGETKVVADLVTSAVNAYGLENLSAAQATDILVGTVREGKAEAPELASSLGMVLPIASALSVSFDQVGAAVAAMTRTGTNASTASIQLRQILASLLKPTQMAEEAMVGMGTSSKLLRQQLKEKGLLSVLGFLKDQMVDNEQAMAQIFPNIRALSGALDLTGSNMAATVKIFDTMTKTLGFNEQAFGAAAKTTSFEFNQALTDLKVAAIELGNTLIPIFRDVLVWVRKAIKWFTGLSDATKRMSLAIAGLLIIAGPLIYVLGTIATLVTAITWPILAVIVALGALTVAFLYARDNWTAIIERMGNLWVFFKNQFITGVQQILMGFGILFSGFVRAYNSIVEAIGGEPIENPFIEMAGGLEDFKGEFAPVTKQFGTLKEALINGAAEIKKALSGMLGTGGGGGGVATTARGVTTPSAQGIGIQQMGEALTPPVIDTSGIERATGAFNDMKIAVFELSTAMQNTLNSALIELGETLGDIFTGDSGASGFFNSILLVVANFIGTFGKALVSAGVAALAFQQLLLNPFAAIGAGIALIAASAVVKNLLTKGPGGNMQGLRSGGFVTDGGLFQLHKDEVVSLPAGSAVTSQRDSRAGGGAIQIFGELRGETIFLANEEYIRRHGNAG